MRKLPNTAWIVVNNFVSKHKFTDLYELLCTAASRFNIPLSIIRTGEIPYDISSLSDYKPPFVIFWDKDIVLARFLESAKMKLFNSAFAIEYCDNKALTTLALENDGIPIPKTLIAPLTFDFAGYNDLSFADDFLSQTKYPIIVKECFGSFGAQVHLVSNCQELVEVVSSFGSRPFLLQEFISESRGKDTRIFVVGDDCPISLCRYNTEGDFRSNITLGGGAVPHTPTQEECDIAISACKALKLDFGAVDLLIGENGPVVCEVNSNPHFRSALECTGKNFADYVIEYIHKKFHL